MDFITDLPLSNNYNSIMVVVDHNSSKGIVLILCTKTLNALGTAKLYHENVYRRFGLPKQTDTHGPPFTQPPPDQIEGHQEFEIEAIVSHKGNGNRRRFLVKWTGYPSSKNQWLPETALSHATNTLKTYKATKNL
ncbi:hypothetical protein M0805_001951 [Coniferiporia weirii]|nr:hypothetical protein M0805_001951 [Coniferiporia weirii]